LDNLEAGHTTPKRSESRHEAFPPPMTKPTKYNKPRSISIFLLDGDPEGVRVAQIAMSTIQAIAFHRSELKRVKDLFAEISRPGVYLLLGNSIDEPDMRVGYVGESEDVAQRLQYHSGKDEKEFWTDTIALISKDENLTKSHVRYIEAKMMALGKANTRWLLANSKDSNAEGKLPLMERAAMDEFIEQAQTLVGALGCDLFKPLSGALATKPVPTAVTASETDTVTFYYKGDGFDAQAQTSLNGNLIVLSGSIARATEAPTVPKGAKKLREQLQNDGVLTSVESGLLFVTDRQFDSPSMAAGVVSGTSVSGRKASWRLSDGTTYGEWDAAKNASLPVDGNGVMQAELPIAMIEE